MTQQEVRRTADQVLSLAPDSVSRKAGSKLGVPERWFGAGCSREGVVWGVCRGGDGTSYRTVVGTADPLPESAGPVSDCTCPSRGSPCAHALGLLLLWARGEESVPVTETPDWVAARGGLSPGEGANSTAGDGGSGLVDPEAARRRAERRAERITAGAAELEQRLADLVRSGLATAERPGYGLWEETAARMVDAQAPGLAARVRELDSVVASGPDWPTRLLEECALLHLLGRGWQHRERLPGSLAATVRTRVGLPSAPAGPPVRDHWLVLAQYDLPDPRLTTRRIWLYGIGSGRTALVLSYGPAGRAPDLALPVGLALDAELSAHPGSGRLRATLGERFAPPAPATVRPPGVTTTEATVRYGEALRDDPWQESVPVTLDDVVPVPDGDGWQVADASGDTALPLVQGPAGRSGLWRLVALSGGGPVKVFGECGHRGFTPLTAWAPGSGEAVRL
ncbi:SWIM zinc finger family protein [Streptomyces antibioticus]|uniref:SWIM zinc finger family protein n=1 Tax=Streptomyces antibioticus TaxID=1890 RepID=UPI0033BA348B